MTETKRTNANRLLWTLQSLMALLFLFAGTMKFVLPPEKMQGPIALPLWFLHFIGIAEITGAVGLIVPGLAHVRTGLTPLAALGLLVIMIGATVLTVATMGALPALLPFVVGAIVLTIGWARWRVVPLRAS